MDPLAGNRFLQHALDDIRRGLEEVLKASPRLWLRREVEPDGRTEYTLLAEELRGRFAGLARRIDRLLIGEFSSFLDPTPVQRPHAFYETLLAFAADEVEVSTPETKRQDRRGQVNSESDTAVTTSLSDVPSHALSLVEKWIDALAFRTAEVAAQGDQSLSLQGRAVSATAGATPKNDAAAEEVKAKWVASELCPTKLLLLRKLSTEFGATSPTDIDRPTAPMLAKAIGKTVGSHIKKCLAELGRDGVIGNPRGKGSKAGYYFTPFGILVAKFAGAWGP